MNTTTEFDELLANIFTTALEGGIDYWSRCIDYHWCANDGTEDLQGFYANIIDIEDDDKVYRIDRDVMLLGCQRAQLTDKVYWSASDRPPDPTDLDAIDAYDYDAGDADAIVQLGLFGEVVHGLGERMTTLQHAIANQLPQLCRNDGYLAADILDMPEMKAIQALLRYCLDNWEWFKYDYFPQANIPDSVREWLGEDVGEDE